MFLEKNKSKREATSVTEAQCLPTKLQLLNQFLRLILVGRSPVKIFAKKIGMTGANGQIVQFVAGMLHNNATELATDLGMSQKSIMVPGLGGKTNPGPFADSCDHPLLLKFNKTFSDVLKRVKLKSDFARFRIVMTVMIAG